MLEKKEKDDEKRERIDLHQRVTAKMLKDRKKIIDAKDREIHIKLVKFKNSQDMDIRRVQQTKRIKELERDEMLEVLDN